MENAPFRKNQEKVSVTVNHQKLDELLKLSEKIISPTETGPNDLVNQAEAIAREAFGGYSVGIKDGQATHLALYSGSECVGASEPNTTWYNPDVDWESVRKAVEAIKKIYDNTRVLE